MFSTPVAAALEHMFLYAPRSELVANPGAMGLEFEEVIFHAADGTRLHGWYLPGEAGQPLVLFCHGNAGNISHRVANLRLLRDLGLSVFIFDYRGYGLSEGRASEQGTYSDMRGALKLLDEKGWVPDSLIYFGRSLGAAVALQLALEQPPAGLILETLFPSIKAMGRLHYPIISRLAGWLLDADYDNLAKIGALKVPLLILHGDRDSIVPLEMAKELFEAAPKPKWFFTIQGADHNDTYALGGEAYRRQWKEFIQVLGKR